MNQKMSIPLEQHDAYGRRVRYLRLSITDRCNLTCMYCSDTSRQNFIPHDNILRYEHFMRFISVAQKNGIGKIRITGGEPFARKGCMDFLRNIHSRFPTMRLTLTTNATLIEPYLQDLASLQLASINISLDSFRAESFKRITGHDLHGTVLANIERLLALGQKVKLNAVLLKGISDTELNDFIHVLKTYPVDMRFIEFMPMGSRTKWTDDLFLSAQQMRTLFEEKVKLSALDPTGPEADYAGPARMWQVEGAKGKLGFISALSNHFCNKCNRMRITSDGKLRSCLFSDREYRLAPMLGTEKVSDAALEKVLANAAKFKPLGEELLRTRQRTAVSKKDMAGIGG